MNKVQAMSVRLCALPWLIGALALGLATVGKASADTCLLSNNWTYFWQGSVDGAGTVTLTNAQAAQGLIPAQHPVLSGTVQVQYASAQTVFVDLELFDSRGNWIAAAFLESPQGDSDDFPIAVEGR